MRVKKYTKQAIVQSTRSMLSGNRGLLLPNKSDALVYTKGATTEIEGTSYLVDILGRHNGTPQPGRGYTGDGTAYITISGLLTTDTITSDSSDTPTCTTNGRLDIANTDIVYGVTIKRSGETIAYYSCAEGAGTVCVNAYLGDGALPDGIITDDSIHTTLIDGTGFDLNLAGFSLRRNHMRDSEDLSTANWDLLDNSGNVSRDGNTIHMDNNESVNPDGIWQHHDIYMVSGTRYAFGVDASEANGGMISVSLRSSDNTTSTWTFFPVPGEFVYHTLVATSTGLGHLIIQPVIVSSSAPDVDVTVNRVHVTEDVTPTDIGTVVMVGDSRTDGTTALNLAEVLVTSNVVDAGVAGERSDEILDRYATDCLSEDPDYVIIWCGINNIIQASVGTESPVSQIMSDIDAMCQLTSCPVILSTETPLGQWVGWNEYCDIWIADFNAQVTAYAAANGHTIVDMHTVAANGNELKASLYADRLDGIHPNSQGYKAYATAFAAVLTRERPSDYVETDTTARPVAVYYPASTTNSTIDAAGETTQYYGRTKYNLEIVTPELQTTAITAMTTTGSIDGATVVLDATEYLYKFFSFTDGKKYKVTYQGSGSVIHRENASGAYSETKTLPVETDEFVASSNNRIQVVAQGDGAVMTGISVIEIRDNPIESIVKFPVVPELITADNGTLFTAGVANSIDLLTLTDTVRVRFGSKGGVAYSTDQDAGTIIKIDKVIGNS